MTSSEQYLKKKSPPSNNRPLFWYEKKKAFVRSCSFIPDVTSVVQCVDNVIHKIIISTQWITHGWFP